MPQLRDQIGKNRIAWSDAQLRNYRVQLTCLASVEFICIFHQWMTSLDEKVIYHYFHV